MSNNRGACASCGAIGGCAHVTPEREVNRSWGSVQPEPGPRSVGGGNAGYVAAIRDPSVTRGRRDEELSARLAAVEAQISEIKRLNAIPGPMGPSGSVGATGAPAKNIVLGTVRTGSEARVTLREEGDVKVLDFVLPKGDRGETGRDSDVAGPQGQRGQDGLQSKDEVVDDLQAFVSEQLAAFRISFTRMVREELQKAGAIDAEGKAILIPGPRGESITGPAGKDGNVLEAIQASQKLIANFEKETRASLESFRAEVKAQVIKEAERNAIQGEPGKDAAPVIVRVGTVVTGDAAAAAVRFENGVHYLDLTLPRAERGYPGPRGAAGNIDAAAQNAIAAVNELLRQKGLA